MICILSSVHVSLPIPVQPAIMKKISQSVWNQKLIAELKKTNPFVEGNIFKSVENVNLDTVVGYKAKGVRHNFLDTYDD